ncbi:MAG: type II toxin-antitoxin system RelB/DinJ family antitoxin [Syntrophobacterales bacterium]|nr:type II toxin-antitoxin system RelB/DinJ family antitoxin [Syntrophobacterales bacterium]
MSDTMIRSRIDASLKIEAQSLLDGMGLSMSEAIRLFLHQVVAEKGLPFPVKLSKEAAEEHDRWFRQQIEPAVEEADKPGTAFIPHEQVRGRWDAKRKELAQRVVPMQRKQN